jgi:hypothetical protein
MATPLDETHLIVKDCWVDHLDRSDYFIHNLLKRRNEEKTGEEIEPPGIAVYLASHINQVSLEDDWGDSDSKANRDMNSIFFKSHILRDMEENKTIRKMIHNRFVFKTCGVALKWFATIKELVNVILWAVRGTCIYDV